jgi:hypothetical protein
MHCPRRRSPERRAPRGHALVQAALRSRVRAEAAATAAQVRAIVRGGPPASLPSAAQYSACLCASTRGNTPRLARRCADAERTTCPNRPTRSRPKTGRRESRPIRIILSSTEYSKAASESREVQLARNRAERGTLCANRPKNFRAAAAAGAWPGPRAICEPERSRARPRTNAGLSSRLAGDRVVRSQNRPYTQVNAQLSRASLSAFASHAADRSAPPSHHVVGAPC